MVKKLWPASATKIYVSEISDLIKSLDSFKRRWIAFSSKHEKPTGEASDYMVDAQMDLSDCFERFMEEE